MQRRTLLLSCGGLLIGAGAYWLFGRSSDDEQIRARVVALGTLADVRADEGAIPRASRVRGVIDDITIEDVRVDIQEISQSRRGRRELFELSMSAPMAYERLSLSWSSMRIEIDPSKTTAGVYGVAQLSGARAGAGEKRDSRDVRIEMQKGDGGWKIRAVVVPRPPEP